MTRPTNIRTRVFLDSGFPEETKEYIDLLGFLDGQTTNPSLIAKKIKSTQTTQLTEDDVYAAYKTIVKEISPLVSESVSIEVYADKHTDAATMIAQGKKMNQWIDNAYIKLPTTAEGLIAAEELVNEGICVNMTLVFSQEQAAAVHSATLGAPKGSVYLSPFIGRLDDRGENGMDLITNIVKMYQEVDSHVDVLTASVRSLDHFLAAMQAGSNIITAPGTILQEWKAQGMRIPDTTFTYERPNLTPIPYQQLDLNNHYADFMIQHDLTDAGLQKFADDWNAIFHS